MQDWTEHTRRTYDTVAASYARLVPDTSYEAPGDLAMIEHFVAELPGSASVLDAGCGTGRMIAHIRSLTPDLVVHGVDLSTAMVAEARASHPDAVIDVADLAGLPYSDAEFDGILAWYSIIHTPPTQVPTILAELRRVLRPSGRVLLGFQAGTGERNATRAYGHEVELHAFLHSVESVAAAATDAGLTVRTQRERPPRSGESHAQGFVLAQR